jgi:hypothetical protein
MNLPAMFLCSYQAEKQLDLPKPRPAIHLPAKVFQDAPQQGRMLSF